MGGNLNLGRKFKPMSEEKIVMYPLITTESPKQPNDVVVENRSDLFQKACDAAARGNFKEYEQIRRQMGFSG